MKKEIVSVEFRYSDRQTKNVFIGIYDTLDEAINEGNKILDKIRTKYEVRENFKQNHLFGNPLRLVSNCCYPTNGIQYFVTIKTVYVNDYLENVMEEIFLESEKHNLKFLNQKYQNFI